MRGCWSGSDVFVGGSKTISPENMKAETKEIGERMAGLQKDMELRFSERFDDENMKHINDVLSLKMLLVKNVKFLTAYDAVECDVRNAGGVENYKDGLRLAGFNESLIGKMLEYAGTE